MIANRGMIKRKVAWTLFNTVLKDIFCELNNDGKKPIETFKRYVHDYLETDYTVCHNTDISIFFDILQPELNGQILDIHILVNEEKIDYVKLPGYYGNTLDTLTEIISDALSKANDNNGLYGASIRYNSLQSHNYNNCVGYDLRYDLSD